MSETREGNLRHFKQEMRGGPEKLGEGRHRSVYAGRNPSGLHRSDPSGHRGYGQACCTDIHARLFALKCGRAQRLGQSQGIPIPP